MSDAEPAATNEAGQARQAGRIAFENLRERTDELELIISGISLLALLALPSWLFQHWLQLELHAEGQRHVLLALGFRIVSGLSMTLAVAFLLHLAVRAYWVGLIGLKATFPEGIRWHAIRSMGEVTRAYQRAHVVDLDKAIDKADRAASIIFALVSLVTLAMLWIGLLMGLVLLGAMGVGALLGASDDDAGRWGFNFFMGLTFLVVMPAMLLDSDWLRRRLGPPGPRRRAVIEQLTRWQSLLFPQRLILPVQLSLESNLPSWIFTAIFLLLVAVSVVLGGLQEKLLRQFAPISSYDYLSDSDAEGGLRSAFYENLRSERDALARVPLIPADMVADGHLRLFLPYLPGRDNPKLRQGCPGAGDQPARRRCLAGLWRVRIDDRPAALDDFIVAERRDLGMRGLQGYLSLSGLAPGRHELRVEWQGAAALENGQTVMGEAAKTGEAAPGMAPGAADSVAVAEGKVGVPNSPGVPNPTEKVDVPNPTANLASVPNLAPMSEKVGVPNPANPTAAGASGTAAPPVVYRIPFWFSPPYQQDLAPAR
ncbi:hypothetical protein [Tahibacter harae]|uniref:ABC transmembrane type-1 domain-containing protein n=1 Tax=Tahibacter harae TaxID=2963937 RepID=A0ABT1QU00_9GAMM|nr:hypothetical protein [Tahibacter harae]MCQ4165759.1 hypothetical protein [Tahibacter harae]